MPGQKGVTYMIQSGEAARTVKRFFDAYLNQRDIGNTLGCLTEGIHLSLIHI